MNEKIIAGMLGAIMTLSVFTTTVLAAYTVGDYPEFLFKTEDSKHLLDAYLVVGAGAKAEDVAGLGDVMARLAGESYELVEVEGTKVVTGGKTEDMLLDTALNASTAFGGTLDDDDLAGLQDTEITIDIGNVEDNYNVHDELQLTSGISLETGLTATSPHEDFKTDVFLEVTADSVKYRYKFDDTLKNGNYIANASTDDPITIKFLGQDFKITGADADSVTVEVGETHWLKAGDSVEVLGKTVTLKSTSSSKAIVDVDGDVEAISEGSTGSVGGLKVYVDTVIDSDGTEFDEAILVVGEYATKSYDNNDPFCVHLSGAEKDACEDDPDWRWVLQNLDTSSPTIGIDYDQNLDKYNEVVKMGESLCLPYDYICIKPDSFTEEDYKTYTLDTDIQDVYRGSTTSAYATSQHMIWFHASGADEDGFLVGSQKTDDVYLRFNTTSGNLDLEVFYLDHDDGYIKYSSTVANGTTANPFDITFQDTTMDVNVTWNAAGTNGNITLVTGVGDDVIIYFERTGNDFDYLGHSDGDTTTTNDLLYGTRDISGWQEDTRAENGMIIKDPDAQTAGDTFEFEVNGDESDFKVNVVITGPESVVTETTGKKYKVNVPITTAVVKLDSEVADPTTVDKHMVLVGGPCANSLAQKLVDDGKLDAEYGCPGGVPGAKWVAGTGYIHVVPDGFKSGRVVVLAAGTAAEDTRLVTSVLQNYDTWLKDRTETSVQVTGTVTAPTITAA